jgi:thioredoxin 1
MPTINIKSKPEFDELIQTHKYAIVYATASWCGPCKAIAPFFDKHASEYDDVSEKITFIKFDTDEVPDLAQELGIRSIPTFFAFEDSELADKLSGANPPALHKLVAELGEKAREG